MFKYVDLIESMGFEESKLVKIIGVLHRQGQDSENTHETINMNHSLFLH